MRKRIAGKSLLCIFTSVCLSLQNVPYTSFAEGAASWKQENGTWKYYDSSDNLLKSWVKIGESWYYFDPITGAMKTGWLLDTNGKWYFLSTADGASEGQMLKSWQIIDGYYYFFYDDGSLAVDTLTPDGWRVDVNGRYVTADGSAYEADKTGYSSVKITENLAKKSGVKSGISGAKSGGSRPGGSGSSSGGSGSSSGGSYKSDTVADNNVNVLTETGNTDQSTGNNNSADNTRYTDGRNDQQNQGGNGADISVNSNEEAEGSIPGRINGGSENVSDAQDNRSSQGQGVSQEDKAESPDKGNTSNEDNDSKKPDATSSASVERWRQKYIAEGKDPDVYKKPNKEDKKEVGNEDSGEGKKEGGKEEKSEEKQENTQKASPSNAESFVIKSQTRMINSEIGWARYVSIAFASGNLQEYSIEVDGTDITGSVSPVDDEGTIVKWRSTVSSPKVLKVIRNSDGAVQEVILNQTKAEEVVVAPQAGSEADMPDYFIANARIPRFDYYLDNYDSEGNVRNSLKYTTFDLKGERERKSIVKAPVRYWAPDSKIDNMGNGEIIVKFSLENEDNLNWFDQITSVRVLNPEYNILNKNMLFETYKETGFGNTGVIKIKLPQSNVVNRGRYYLNISSDYVRETRTVPIHLVDATNFKMILSSSTASPVTGSDIKFTVKGENGESFGNDIRIVAQRLVLTKPSGNKVELEKIKDWYVIGDLLTVCGSSGDGENKKINTDEEGVYTITLYADGYQAISKKVEVRKNNIQAAAVTTASGTAGKIKAKKVDVVSSATGGKSGGSAGGSVDFSSEAGIGGYTNGNYQFDYDLLVNAIILNELGRNNESSKAVVKRWFDSTKVDYVLDKDATTLYKFEDYLDKVTEVRLDEQREVSFAEFKENGASSISQQSPHDIKLVLEDGLLGSTTAFREQVGKAKPSVMGTVALKGEAFTLTTDDPEYFEAITSLNMDGNSAVLRSDSYLKQYEFNADKTELKIYPSAFNSYNPPIVGDHVLRIEANGYKVNKVTLSVKQGNTDIGLEFNSKSEDQKYRVGEEVQIKVTGEESAARDYLSNITSITVNKPDKSSRPVYTASVGGSANNDYYEVMDNKLVFMPGLFTEAGEYTIHVVAKGYRNKLIKVNVEAVSGKPELEKEPEVTLKVTPTVKNVEYSKAATMPFNRYYKIVFDTENMSVEDINNFINADNVTVEVNNVKYSKKNNLNISTVVRSYVANNDGTILLSLDGFDKDENIVKISVPGYKVLSEQVNKDGASPTISFKEADSNGSDRLKLEFDTNDVYVQDYLANIKRGRIPFKVSVNGKPYDKLIFSRDKVSKGKYKITENSAYGTVTGLEVSLEDVDLSKPVDISIELGGYKTVSASYISPKKVKAVPEVKSYNYSRIERMPFNRYYELVFNTDKMSKEEINGFIDSDAATVEVNGIKYSKKESLDGRDVSKSYVAYDDATMWLSTDGLDKDVNTVKITVEGYESFEYQITKEIKTPAMTFKKADFNGSDRVKIDFDTSTLFVQDYLAAIKRSKTPLKVTVNGNVLSKIMFSFDRLSQGKYKIAENSAYGTVTGLELSLEGIDLSKPVYITVEIEGYKAINLSYIK